MVILAVGVFVLAGVVLIDCGAAVMGASVLQRYVKMKRGDCRLPSIG
ncbi:Uncharacterised protein [Salmonella bongori]|nr:Uncharacterised protein [Salmonella bongori]